MAALEVVQGEADPMSTADVAVSLGCSDVTARRYLARLDAIGLVEDVGAGSECLWRVPGSQVRALLRRARDAGLEAGVVLHDGEARCRVSHARLGWVWMDYDEDLAWLLADLEWEARGLEAAA